MSLHKNEREDRRDAGGQAAGSAKGPQPHSGSWTFSQPGAERRKKGPPFRPEPLPEVLAEPFLEDCLARFLLDGVPARKAAPTRWQPPPRPPLPHSTRWVRSRMRSAQQPGQPLVLQRAWSPPLLTRPPSFRPPGRPSQV